MREKKKETKNKVTPNEKHKTAKAARDRLSEWEREGGKRKIKRHQKRNR